MNTENFIAGSSRYHLYDGITATGKTKPTYRMKSYPGHYRLLILDNFQTAKHFQSADR
jgi:hypothetical protein